MALAEHNQATSGLAARLRRTRAATRLFVAFERLWPLALPLPLVLASFLAVSWFGLFRLVSDDARIALLVLFAVAAAASLLPLRGFRMPAPSEIDRRIEKANRLEHAPVSTLTDRLASDSDPMTTALWREHQRRMAERVGPLETDLPRTGVPKRDPWGLRAVIALLLVTAFAYSYGPFGGRLGDGFHAHSDVNAIPPRIDAWVTPPAYTGRAPIFITAAANQDESHFAVPESSMLTLRVVGGSGDVMPVFIGADGNEREIGQSTDAESTRRSWRQFSAELKTDGMLRLRSGGTDLRAWTFAVTPDAPPTISFADDPTRAVNGTLELAHDMDDDYGPASARAEFEQVEQAAPNARPLYDAPEMPLTLPRRGSDNTRSETSRDLTAHPWAGTRVRARLKVVDAAGQTGSSEVREFVLPEKPFTNPLAKAVLEQRRIIALDANRKRRALELMDAITLRPEDTISNLSHYLAIMSARTRLKMADSDEALRGVVDYLWDIARGIEDGDLTAAEKRLKQAQEALRRALDEGASDEEIERLIAELREAMQEFLREFAERARQNPSLSQQMPPQGRELSQRDLDRMLDQIEELAKSGARDRARDLLAQMENMFNNLQAGRHQQQQGDSQQGQMRQQMNKLGELMRRQQELMNETFRQNQQRRGQRGNGEQQQNGRSPGNRQGEQGQGMTAEEFAEALRRLQEGQGQLRNDLGEFVEGLEGMGIQPGEDFGDAGQAMGRAGDALGEGEGGEAVDQQGQALEALRRGAQGMMQQMQQAMQGENGGMEEGGRANGANLDPLGRPRASSGPDFDQSVKVPDEIDVQRARRILEAIRKRLGEALSPEVEKEYLERLLDLR